MYCFQKSYKSNNFNLESNSIQYNSYSSYKFPFYERKFSIKLPTNVKLNPHQDKRGWGVGVCVGQLWCDEIIAKH